MHPEPLVRILPDCFFNDTLILLGQLLYLFFLRRAVIVPLDGIADEQLVAAMRGLHEENRNDQRVEADL